MPVDAPLYPVGLVVAGRPVLVVGGGRVAARKAADLVACGARVTVVAPEVDAALAERGDLAVELQILSFYQQRKGDGAGRSAPATPEPAPPA